MVILGIDPGSRLTGFGCLESKGGAIRFIQAGTIRLVAGSVTPPFEERILNLHKKLDHILAVLKPDVVVVEKVFFAKNAVSALKLGQVRGVVLLSALLRGSAVFEYSVTEVKHAVVGQGHAPKEQVAAMLKYFVGKQKFETMDASDALGLALCHAMRAGGAIQTQKGSESVGKKKKSAGSMAAALEHLWKGRQ